LICRPGVRLFIQLSWSFLGASWQETPHASSSAQLKTYLFLDQHGYGRARSYYLVQDGKTYDSKAIVGVAYGYQLPKHGLLTPEDFNGGEATVKRVLEQMKFTVERIPKGELVRVEPGKKKRMKESYTICGLYWNGPMRISQADLHNCEAQ
jgi:hypothetical protein